MRTTDTPAGPPDYNLLHLDFRRPIPRPKVGGIVIDSGTSTQLCNAPACTQASNNWFAHVNDLRGNITAVAPDKTGSLVEKPIAVLETLRECRPVVRINLHYPKAVFCSRRQKSRKGKPEAEEA